MVGAVVSHYRITARIGGGAMGVVYRAEDLRLGRPVALKFLPPELTGDATAVGRFLREAHAAAALDHPNICAVHEIDRTEDGRHFIVMPFCEGETLKSILTRGPLDAATALHYARQVAAGLAHAQRHGVVHRDIKPANLMVTRQGVVKIVDFGLARLHGDPALTRTGAMLGTAAYMAPEQVQGAEAGHTADIWSLGVVLYEMLAGRRPFAAVTEPALLYSIVHEDPPLLTSSTTGRAIPAVCADILGSCLVKDPKARYESAADLEHDLGEAWQAVSSPGGSTLRLAVPRRRILRWLPAAVLIALAAAAALSTTVRGTLQRMITPNGGHSRGAAVLPIATDGEAGSEERVFADGLTWLLTDRLADLEPADGSIWVVPPRQVVGHDIEGSDRAHLLLGVDRTLRSTLRLSGDRLSLNFVGYDARTRKQVSREISDRLANLETWQQQTPRLAAEALGMHVPAGGLRLFPHGNTTVPAAYLALVRGLGRLFPDRGETDPAAAAAEFRRAVAQDSSFTDAWTGLGRALWMGGGKTDSLQAVAAADCFRRAASLDPDLAWPWALLGEVQSRWGDLDEAEASLQRALALDPRQEWALDRLASVEYRRGDKAASAGAFRRAVAVRPGNTAALLRLGSFCYYEARYEEAADSYRRVVELTPNDYIGYNHLAAVLFEQERYDEAIATFEQSLSLSPSYQAYNGLGGLYFYRRRFGDAIDMYRRALALAGGSYAVWGQLAESYYWAPGLRDSSRAAYREAIKLADATLGRSPGDVYVIADLATYHARLGETGPAENYLARLEARDDLTPEAMFAAADASEQLGRRREALDWLERACAAGLSLAKIEFYPGLRELRSSPRYREIVEKYGT